MADRPPFILAFCADQQGCGFHRVMMPLASLVEVGVADGRLDMAIWPDEAGLACAPDVVVWQRQVEDDQIAAMARWRKLLPNAIFIYELDDYLDDIPVESFHAGFMPTDIKGRIERALVHCDRISTTTEPMAHWLRTIAPLRCHIDVVPNALPVARLRERSARTTGKLRVGFAGGISHSGDIQVLRHAMETIGDDVTWVFFGMNFEDAPVDIEFHEGVPATLYLDKMASLDLDLMLAPLADNPFNRCKSNLRLVEAAAIGAAIIAQDLTPYHVHRPPVFAYATDAESWTASIQTFIAASKSERQRSADGLRTWAGRYYTLERLLQKRMEAWLPAFGPPWRPNAITTNRQEKQVIAASDAIDVRARMPFLAPHRVVTEGLEAACRTALTLGADLLWMRPATSLDEAGYDRMQKLLHVRRDVASVVPLASDGANGFPQVDRWTPMSAAAIAQLAKLTADQFGERTLTINAPTGPVICLSAQALSMLGLPDVKGCDGNEEQALLEWGLRATARAWKHTQSLASFAGSQAPPVQPSQNAMLRLQARGFSEHLRANLPDSHLTSEERTRLEIRLLHAQWGGPRPGSMGFENDYSAWSMLRQVQDLAKTKADWSGLSLCYVRGFDATQDWPDNAYVVFTDSSVKLYDAAYWFEEALAHKRKYTPLVLYGDNDTIIGDKVSPEFKPDFDPTLFLAQDYVTPICAVHTSLLTTIPANRTDLFNIVLDAFVGYGTKVFQHIPRVMGSVTLRSEPETIALETLERQLIVEKTFGGAVKATANRQIIGCLTVTRDWKPACDVAPLVSIVVPTLGSGRLIQPCVATLLQHTAYPNYEIIVVQNGDKRTQPELSETILADPRVRVVHYAEDFNWSKINNWAIRAYAKGDYIVTMNDDVCVGSKQWLDVMMGHAILPDVGVVGAKLVHPAGVVQHVGVICHNGIAGHMHKGIPLNQAGHLGRALLTHEAVAVTGACMLFSRASFEDINGFDTSLASNYNDTVFCVQQYKRGRRNVVELSAELLHPEASTRPQSHTPEGMAILLRDNARMARLCPDTDPYWNPNMALIANADGLAIQGLNADMLDWTDFTPRPDSVRTLLVNDPAGSEGGILSILRTGGVPFLADLSGFSLRLVAPGPVNMLPWDIRDPDRIAADLKSLGINQVVLRSLVGTTGAAPPVEALRALSHARLGIPVDIQPTDFALVAPWLIDDGRSNEQKLFGYVDMAAWKAAYADATGQHGAE